MKRPAAAMLLALALGCGTGGTIEGRIVMAEGPEGLDVYAALYRVDALSRLYPLGQRRVDVTRTAGGETSYRFDALFSGRYVIAAFVDHAGTGRIDENLDEAELSEVVFIDPSAADQRSANLDLYLGMSAPNKVTLRGTLHLSERARQLPVSLYVLDGPIDDPEVQVVRHRTIAGRGEVPFHFHNISKGSVHLLATADVGGDGRLDNDLLALSHQNPVAVDPSRGSEVDGLELWLDLQAPHLGGISGALMRNGVVSNHVIQLAAYDRDPTLDADARTMALLNVSPSSEHVLPFSMPSLPLGQLYLVAFHGVDEGDRMPSTWRVWPGMGKEALPLRLDADTRLREDVQFPLGVGRISGTLNLEKVPGTVSKLAVVAFSLGEIRQLDVLSLSPIDGRISAPFEMFGLEDGRFELQLVPDASGDGRFEDEVAAEYYFSCRPGTVEIVGGDRAGCDFEASLGAR